MGILSFYKLFKGLIEFFSKCLHEHHFTVVELSILLPPQKKIANNCKNSVFMGHNPGQMAAYKASFMHRHTHTTHTHIHACI